MYWRFDEKTPEGVPSGTIARVQPLTHNKPCRHETHEAFSIAGVHVMAIIDVQRRAFVSGFGEVCGGASPSRQCCTSRKRFLQSRRAVCVFSSADGSLAGRAPVDTFVDVCFLSLCACASGADCYTSLLFRCLRSSLLCAGDGRVS